MHHIQTAMLLAVFLMTSIMGQTGIIKCLCSGDVALSADVTGGCSLCDCTPSDDSSGDAPDGHSSPCGKDDCYVVVLLSVLDVPAAPTLESVSFAAVLENFSPTPLAKHDAAASLILLDHPPPRHTIPLTVLYGSFLI